MIRDPNDKHYWHRKISIAIMCFSVVIFIIAILVGEGICWKKGDSLVVFILAFIGGFLFVYSLRSYLDYRKEFKKLNVDEK